MKTKLSFSQIQKYQMCPRSYKFYYVDKIRVNKTSGALVFGKALDSALNNLLLTRDIQKSIEIFHKEFASFELNGTTYSTKEATNLVYSLQDYDKDLADASLEVSKPMEELIRLRKQYGFDNMSEEDKLAYNLQNYHVMLKKAEIMLTTYYNTVLPKITKVHKVQEKIERTNNHGDTIIGFIDAIVDYDGFKNVLIDHKTSSVEYEPNSVKYSQQLALYKYFSPEIEWLGYIVFNKRISKNKTKICSKCQFDGTSSKHKTCNNTINGVRCHGEWEETIKPEANIQIIIDKIDDVVQELVIENLDDINEGIKQKHFPRNLQSCLNYWGGECDYFKVCYKKEAL